MPTTKKGNKKNVNKEQTLNDLLVIKLQALFDVENQLIKALPIMAKKATDPDLREAFEKHLEQTKGHAERLERAFASLDIPAKKLQGEAIRGLIADAQWVIKNVKGAEALDANLIAAAQYVEHYEIAGYSSALDWAKLLDNSDVADLLETTLGEEQETSDSLTQLAESTVNEKAMGPESDDEDEDSDKDNEK